MLQELCKRIQHCCATLQRSRNKRNVGSCWKVWPVSNFAQQHATTSNNMQRGVQTDAPCNIQQCWELLANNVASVCTGLKKNNNPLHQQAVCLIFGLQHMKRGKASFLFKIIIPYTFDLGHSKLPWRVTASPSWQNVSKFISHFSVFAIHAYPEGQSRDTQSKSK